MSQCSEGGGGGGGGERDGGTGAAITLTSSSISGSTAGGVMPAFVEEVDEEGTVLFRDEEEEEKRRFGGIDASKLNQSFLGPYVGHHAWKGRLSSLVKRVNGFKPREGKHLSFFGASRLTGPKGWCSAGGKGGGGGEGGGGGGGGGGSRAMGSGAWYECPVFFVESVFHPGEKRLPRPQYGHDFNAQLFTSFGRPSSASLGTQSQISSTGTESMSSVVYPYEHSSILPSAASLFDQQAATLMCIVVVKGGLVVGFYGNSIDHTPGAAETRKTSSLHVLDRVSVTGIAMYRTDTQVYSVSRSEQC